MIALWVACGLLAAGFCLALGRLLLLKSDIRQLAENLAVIAKSATNAQLRTATFDKDLADFAQSVNSLLEKSRQDSLERLRSEKDLKSAITNISHDLRTPLTSAKGYLQMLAGGRLSEDDRSRYIAIVQERMDALAGLMDSLFDFARAAEGAMELKKVDACKILRDILAASYPEFTGKGFCVETSIPDAPVYFLADESGLARVLQNLVKNACAHGKDVFRASLTEEGFAFANKADGLCELDTRRIFERFYTMDAARTNKRTGLGLAIAKELAARMGGRISASVETDEFVLRLALPGWVIPE